MAEKPKEYELVFLRIRDDLIADETAAKLDCTGLSLDSVERIEQAAQVRLNHAHYYTLIQEKNEEEAYG